MGLGMRPGVEERGEKREGGRERGEERGRKREVGGCLGRLKYNRR